MRAPKTRPSCEKPWCLGVWMHLVKITCSSATASCCFSDVYCELVRSSSPSHCKQPMYSAILSKSPRATPASDMVLTKYTFRESIPTDLAVRGTPGPRQENVTDPARFKTKDLILSGKIEDRERSPAGNRQPYSSPKS